MEISELWCPIYTAYLGETSDPERSTRIAYYLFVEESLAVGPVEVLDAPDGSDFSPDHPVLRERPFRFRTSGVAAADFHRWLDRFDELTPGEVSEEQALRRRGRLREFFAEVPVPVIDIYLAPGDRDLRAMRLMFQSGSWHLALIDYREGAQGERPVYSSSGAPDEGPGVRRGQLVRLAPVAPPVELRLRDIFSLNQVPDGDFDPDEGDDRAPLDPDLPAPLSAAEEAEAWEARFRTWQLQAEAEEKEKAAPATVASPYGKDKAKEAEKTQITLSRGR